MSWYTGCNMLQGRFIIKWNDSIPFDSVALQFSWLSWRGYHWWNSCSIIIICRCIFISSYFLLTLIDPIWNSIQNLILLAIERHLLVHWIWAGLYVHIIFPHKGLEIQKRTSVWRLNNPSLAGTWHACLAKADQGFTNPSRTPKPASWLQTWFSRTHQFVACRRPSQIFDFFRQVGRFHKLAEVAKWQYQNKARKRSKIQSLRILTSNPDHKVSMKPWMNASTTIRTGMRSCHYVQKHTTNKQVRGATSCLLEGSISISTSKSYDFSLKLLY